MQGKDREATSFNSRHWTAAGSELHHSSGMPSISANKQVTICESPTATPQQNGHQAAVGHDSDLAQELEQMLLGQAQQLHEMHLPPASEFSP